MNACTVNGYFSYSRVYMFCWHTQPWQRNFHSMKKDRSSHASEHDFDFSETHSQNYVLPWIESHASVLKRPFLNKCLAWCFRGIWGISRMLQIKITWRKATKSVLVIPKLRENGRIRMGLVCTEQRGEIACNVQDSLALVLLFHVRSVTSKSSYCFSVIKG